METLRSRPKHLKLNKLEAKDDKISTDSRKEDENLIKSQKDGDVGIQKVHLTTETGSIGHESVYEGIVIFSSDYIPPVSLGESVAVEQAASENGISEFTGKLTAVKLEEESSEHDQNIRENLNIKKEPLETSNARVKNELQASPPRAVYLNLEHSPLRTVVSSTKDVPQSTFANWKSNLSSFSLHEDKPRIFIIVWAVTHLFYENNVSANAFGSAGIAANKGNDNSIRRGLHDIFDLNLGFETMNSLSCLKVDESELCRKLEIPIGLPQHVLFNHLRARIDLLIRLGLFGHGAFTDYRKACLWLATLSHLNNDATALTPRAYSVPFILFLASREDVFNQNRTFYRIPPLI